MQFRKILSLFIIAVLFNFLLINCKKSSDTTDSGSGSGETGVATITSLGSGGITTPSGYKLYVIPGTVPANNVGTTASVAFSIETKVTPTQDIPATATRVSDFMKIGPEGFSFRWPVKITIPFSGADAQAVKILYFNALLGKWVIVPANEIDNTNHTISADVISLGYFCAATISSTFSKPTADDSDGGFEFTGDPTYYYTLTVKAVSNWKYPAQAAWYPNLVGASGSTGSYPAGGPLPTTHIHLAQATYQIWVTRTKPGTLSTLPVIETYNVAATGTISQPVTYTSSLSSGTGWTALSMPTGGSWVTGSPSNWPTPTVTYGTGEFQATLTWINNSTADTDIDLHLFGPNNMHVYYNAQTSTDGSVQLDRDWLTAYGNAVENIYSLSTMPAGQYTIRVNLYSGSTNNYSVRIIRAGTVHTYTGSISTVNPGNTESQMITLETFTK